MEGGPSWKKNRNTSSWAKINKNLDDWATSNNYTESQAEAAYDKLTDVQKNGVRYQADENKEGGGYGALQITVNNTNLSGRSDTLNKISKTLINPKTNKPYADFNTGVKPALAEGDFGLGLDLSLSYYRDEHHKPWGTNSDSGFNLNKSSGYDLRYSKGGINPGELNGKDADGNKIKLDPPKHVANSFSAHNTGKTKDPYSPKEKREIDRITKMDKAIALHRDQSSAFASLGDNNKFEVKTKLENILKDVHADMKSGKFDKDMKAQYEKDGKTLPLLKDASRGKIVSGIIAERMGWNDLDLNNPEILGIARAQSAYVFELTQSEEFQESIGGDQKIDSLLEDVLEDNSSTSGRFAEFTGIPELGYALPEVEKEVRTPIGQGGVKGGKEEDVDFWDEPGKKGKINLDGYEQWRDEYAREHAPSLFFDQPGDQSTAAIITEAQGALAEQREEEIPVDEDADVEDDFEIEEISVDLAPELDLSFEDWKIKYPDGTQEEYDNRGTTEEAVEGDSGYQDWLKDNPGGTQEEYQQYFDLRGDTSGLGEESFLDKIGGLSSLIGLATGAMGLGQALKDVDIPKDPKLGPAFQQRLEESKRLAQQGLTPSELAKAHNDLDSSYATGIENIVRGSAGNRAQFLAGLGGLDVARQSALMDIAVADAGMQRQNQEKYDKMMMVNEQYEAARTSKYDQAKYEQDMATKSAGAALAGSALSMVNENIGNRQLNRYNKMKTEKLMRDMGYRNDSNGKSTEQQLGVDPETGEKVQTSFTLPGDDSYVAPNLLSADEQVINTEVENAEKTNEWATQNQGLLGALGGNYSGLIGVVDPSEKARLAKEKRDNEIKNNAIASFNSGLNF